MAAAAAASSAKGSSGTAARRMAAGHARGAGADIPKESRAKNGAASAEK